MVSIQVRSALLSDVSALGALHVESWRETYRDILPAEMLANLSVETRTTMWTKILGDRALSNKTAVYVAEDQGRIIGFGSCGAQRDTSLAEFGFDGEFSAIYILKSHQGLGLGRSIMRAMGQELLKQGCVAATLWVLRDNTAARGFYEHVGGAIVSEKQEERSGATLIELAYAWRDLSVLVRGGRPLHY